MARSEQREEEEMNAQEIIENLNALEQERFKVDDHGNHLVEPSVWIEIENEARADEGEGPLTEQEEQEIYDNFDRAQARLYEIYCEKRRLLNEYFLLKGNYPDMWESFGKKNYTESAERRSGYFIKQTIQDWLAWNYFGKDETEDVFIRCGEDEARARFAFESKNTFVMLESYRAEFYKWEDDHPVLLDTIEY